MASYTSIEAIRRANIAHGDHWFDESTMRFFHTRILPTIYHGRYFITSEPYAWRGPRRYTIRYAGDGGRIDTVGEMGQFATREAAIRKIAHLGDGPSPCANCGARTYNRNYTCDACASETATN